MVRMVRRVDERHEGYEVAFRSRLEGLQERLLHKPLCVEVRWEVNAKVEGSGKAYIYILVPEAPLETVLTSSVILVENYF